LVGCTRCCEEQASLTTANGRLVYVHVVRGTIDVNGQGLQTGDAAMLTDETTVKLMHGKEAEVLVFDLPPYP
jgi:quercetin 2,3-dioxygenase